MADHGFEDGRAARGGESFEMTGDRSRRAMNEGAMEFTVEELREFLEGDVLNVRADPEFKERLRRTLWDMVRARRSQPCYDEEDA
jgi:hypothetical protein